MLRSFCSFFQEILANDWNLDRHYVAFIRKPISTEGGNESWVLFNDEKVVKAEGDVDEMKKFAYVYFFERV